MAGFSPVTYVLLLKRIKASASGIKKIYSDGIKQIIFEMNDGTKFYVDIPDVFLRLTQNQFDDLEKDPSLEPTLSSGRVIIVDNKKMYIYDGVNFNKIGADFEVMTEDDINEVIENITEVYYRYDSTELTKDDLMNITPSDKIISKSNVKSFLDSL